MNKTQINRLVALMEAADESHYEGKKYPAEIDYIKNYNRLEVYYGQIQLIKENDRTYVYFDISLTKDDINIALTDAENWLKSNKKEYLTYGQQPTKAILYIMQDLFSDKNEVNIIDIYIKPSATADVEATIKIRVDGKIKRFRKTTDQINETMKDESEDLTLAALEVFKEEIINDI